MGPFCIVCGQSKAADVNIRLFVVPKDESRLIAWIEASGRVMKKGQHVCSRHFAPEDLGFRKLKAGSLPFLCTHHPKDRDHCGNHKVKVGEQDSSEKFANGKDVLDNQLSKIKPDDSNNLLDTNDENILNSSKTEEPPLNKYDSFDICDNKIKEVPPSDEQTKICDDNIERLQPVELIEEDTEESNHPIPLPYKCNLCDFASYHPGYIKRHVNTVHLKSRQHKCNSCDYETPDLRNMKEHVDSIHHSLKRHHCHLCDFLANDKLKLEADSNLVHLDLKQHKCNLCGYSANDRSYLKRHMEGNHLKLKRYKCHLCLFATNDQSHLKNHIKNIHPKKHKCSFCDYSSNRKFNLLNHTETVHLKLKHKCDYCDFATKQKKRLRRHINSIHFDSKQSDCESELKSRRDSKTIAAKKKPSVESESKIYNCELCDFATKQKKSLREHIDSVHLGLASPSCELNGEDPIITNPENQIDIIELDSGLYNCVLCDFVTGQEESLKKHIDSIHLGSQELSSRLNADDLIIINSENQRNIVKSDSELCDFATRQKANLEKYIDSVNVELGESSGEVDAENLIIINPKNQINIVELNSEKNNCKLCDFATKHKMGLEKHIDSIHLGSEELSSRLNADDLIIINSENQRNIVKSDSELGDFATRQKANLEKYIDSVNVALGESSKEVDAENLIIINPKNQINIIELNSEKYDCKLCDFATKHKTGLEKHIDSIHLGSEELSSRLNADDLIIINSENQRNIVKSDSELCDFATREKANLEKYIDSVNVGLGESSREVDAENLIIINPKNQINIVELNSEKYNCKLCDFATKHKMGLEKHINSIHLGLEELGSEFDAEDQTMTTPENPSNIIESDSTIYNCKLCNFVANRKIDLEKHIDFIHLGLGHSSRGVKTKKHPIEVKKIPPNFKAYNCQLCNFATRNKITFEKHIDSVHLDLNPTSCEFNAEVSGLYYCQLCDFATDEDITLENHVDFVHSETNADNQINTAHICDNDDENKKCSVCESIKSQRGDLETDISDVQLKRHECNFCDFIARKIDGLRKHIRNVHLNLKPFKCTSCNYAANQKKNLKRHIEIFHMNFKRHKCEFCQFRGSDRTTLKRHVDCVHLNLKKYRCHLCDYASGQKSSVKSHIESVHLNIKKYKCISCDYSTNMRNNLRKHTQMVHLNSEQFSCGLCDFCAMKKSELKNHMRTHHPNNEQID